MVSKWVSEERRRAAQGLTELYSGQLSDDEARDINGWQSDSPEYRQEFLATAHLLSDMEKLVDDPELQALMGERSGLYRRRYMVAAAITLSAVVGLMFSWVQDTDIEVDSKRYVTRVGEQRQVELEDGTTIDMNTATQLIVTVTDTERRVTLTRGEAFFDVTHNPERPFTVDAGYRSISVLGTEFNVLRSPETIQVSVAEGVVAFHASEEGVRSTAPLLGAKEFGAEEFGAEEFGSNEFSGTTTIESTQQVRIEAGWRVDFDAREQSLSGAKVSDVENMASWRTGFLEFAGEPLYRVVKELNRYNAKKILVEDADIINLKIYAAVKVDRMDLALDGLEQTLPIRVTHHFDRIVLTHKQ